jgi:hypothetical protein
LDEHVRQLQTFQATLRRCTTDYAELSAGMVAQLRNQEQSILQGPRGLHECMEWPSESGSRAKMDCAWLLETLQLTAVNSSNRFRKDSRNAKSVPPHGKLHPRVVFNKTNAAGRVVLNKTPCAGEEHFKEKNRLALRENHR